MIQALTSAQQELATARADFAQAEKELKQATKKLTRLFDNQKAVVGEMSKSVDNLQQIVRSVPHLEKLVEASHELTGNLHQAAEELLDHSNFFFAALQQLECGGHHQGNDKPAADEQTHTLEKVNNAPTLPSEEQEDQEEAGSQCSSSGKEEEDNHDALGSLASVLDQGSGEALLSGHEDQPAGRTPMLLATPGPTDINEGMTLLPLPSIF